MLGPAESACLEEAIRDDRQVAEECLATERIAAAIAVVSSAPLRPSPQQLPEILARIGAAKPRRTLAWLAAAGWATAACLTAALLLRPDPSRAPANAATRTSQATPDRYASSATTLRETPGSTLAHEDPDSGDSLQPSPRDSNAAPSPDPEKVRVLVRTETRRLVEQVESLRRSLARHEERERILFKAVPGVALPLMMEMKPPGLWSAEDPALAANQSPSPVEALVRDASASASLAKVTAADARTAESPTIETDPVASSPTADPSAAFTTNPPAAASDNLPPDGTGAASATEPVLAANTPSAIPIYDAARDVGTIRIKDLPAAGDGMSYRLWATFAGQDQATLIGSLPPLSGSGSDSFDFNLGSLGIIPSGYALTRSSNRAASAPPPDASNTVLKSPPPAAQGND